MHAVVEGALVVDHVGALAGASAAHRVVDPDLHLRVGVDGRVVVVAPGVIDVVDQDANVDPAVGGLERPVEQQATGEVALPQVVLHVEALLGQIGSAKSGAKGLTWVGKQTHAGQRRVGRGVVIEEFTE